MNDTTATERTIRCRVDDDPPADWADYVLRHADATVFHDPRWATLMRDVYGNACFYLTARRSTGVPPVSRMGVSPMHRGLERSALESTRAATSRHENPANHTTGETPVGLMGETPMLRSERCVGVLALVLQRSWLMGDRLCSLPYLDASGVLADDDTAAAALLSQACDVMRERHAKWIELRQEHPLGDLPTRNDKLTMRLALPAGQAELMENFRGKTRNQIRKALSVGMTADVGGPERLADFHHVYERTMRDLGSPPHSLEFFRRLMETFGRQAGVHTIRDGQRLVGASLVLEDARRVYVPWSGSDWRHGSGQANTMLFWSMLAACSDRGVKEFDFGRSTRGGGTHVFKQKWGAAEVPLHWHYILRPGQSPPTPHLDTGVLKLAGTCWRKLPICAVRVLGPRIIRKVS
ncbi:MAG: GNAT family N-acetyltransferase [Phycisphaerae bacterium]|nr:GNAT family N-acetyltransferase [Phycisphaerae bacterium]